MDKISNNYVGVLLSICVAIFMLIPAGAATSSMETEAFQGKEHFIINVYEPVDSSWIDVLDQMGIQTVTYLPEKGYEAFLTYDQMAQAEELDFVKCINEYPVEDKISEYLEGDEVIISLVNAGSMPSSLQAIYGLMDVFDEDDTAAGHIIKGRILNMNDINIIAGLADVHFIETYFPEQLHGEMGTQILGGGLWLFDDDADTDTPYRALGNYGSHVNQLGWTGEGVRIAIADTGVGDGTTGDSGHNDFTGRVVGGYDFGTGGWQDNHGHGTHCIGLAAGDTYNGNGVTYGGFGPYYVGQGQAPDSTIYVEQIFEGASGSWVGPADYRQILYENGGSQIHTNSWGANTGGAYSAADEAFDEAIRDSDGDPVNGNQQIVVFTSAGNAGSGLNTIGSPGNSKNIITVGGTQNYAPDSRTYGADEYSITSINPDTMYSSSSRGWTDDGRIKPDIVTPGQNTLSLSSPLVVDGLFGDYSQDSRYTWCTGTSQSCPQGAGGGAVVYGWYQDPSNYGVEPTPATVKALLINTAVDIATADIPNQNEGWGRMNIMPIIDQPAPFMIFQDPSELITDAIDTYTFSYVNPAEPVKITLAYTDRFALSGAAITLQNQVNLEVESPTGTIYHGNAFSGGWSTTGNPSATFDTNADGYDDRNNVECVYLNTGQMEIGQYTVRIIGTSVPADCDNDGSNDQDYSLVMYNCEDVSARGTVDLDQNVYAGENLATITVSDTDLNTNGLVQQTTITVTSTSEPGGESVTLTETGGDTSVFVGTLTLSQTNGAGILLVSHDDVITATYNDADDGTGSSQVVTDTATVDSGVAPTSGLTVEWWAPAAGSTETRFMRSDAATVNGLTGDSLGTSQSAVTQTVTLSSTSTIFSGISVFSRSSGGAETPISSGIVAIASTGGTETVSATWDCPQTTISDTDSIVVKWYCGGTNPPATLVETFTTEVLGGTQLSAATWTFYSYLSERNNADRVSWGSATANTRIEGFTWAAFSNPLEHNTLNWTLSGDDGAGANDVVGYNIYRAPASGGPWTNIDTVPAGTGTYTDIDRGMSDGTQWWYIVRGEDGAGNEDTNTNAVPEPGSVPDSAPVSSAGYAGASPTSNNPVTISWTATDDNDLTQVELFYRHDGGAYASWTDGTNPATAAGTADSGSWSFDFPDGAGTYDFYTRASDDMPQTEAAPGSPDVTIQYIPIQNYDFDLAGVSDNSWIFVSFPLDMTGDVLTIIDDATWGDGDTTWEVIHWYDPTDVDHWKTYDKAQATAGLAQDMPTIDNSMGMWIKITTSGTVLTVGEGFESASTDITLNAGWNLIGYPAQDDSTYDVGDLKADTGATMVEGYGAGPYNIVTLANNYVLQRGEAYWVFVGVGGTWTVNW